jgi:hypothetical protein
VLRRSRRRRVANVALAGVTVAAVVAGGFLAAGAVGPWDRSTPADQVPPEEVAPTPISAIWPITDARSLAFSQAAVDAGTLDPAGPVETARAYAVQQLGWDEGDVVVIRSAIDTVSGTSTVAIERSPTSATSTAAIGLPELPETELTLRQLAEVGDDGIWLVVGADTPSIVPGFDQEGRWPTSTVAGSWLDLRGTRVGEDGEWLLEVSLLAFARIDGTGVGTFSGCCVSRNLGTDAGAFSESLPIAAEASGTAVVSVAITEPSGEVVALDSFPIMVATPSEVPAGEAIAAVWPETTVQDLDAAQARADAGNDAWRLDPVDTAAAFATDILGWDRADVRTDLSDWVSGGGTSYAAVELTNAGLGPARDTEGPPAPATYVQLQQLGTQGDRGVWNVTRATSERIAIDTLVPDASGPYLGGRVIDAASEWRLSVWPIVGDRRLDTATPVEIDPSGAFTVQVTDVGGLPEGTMIGILTALWDPASRDAILNAAAMGDVDRLAGLIDPNRFSYNFSDRSNPVPEWHKDPAVVDTLATILQLPFATTEGTPDVGTIYVWPALVDADLTNLTEEQQGMLDTLGITARDVQDMLDAFGAYVGPRTGIAEDGTWLYYTTGGD